MSVGERITTLRKEKNISQYQLAKLMGVSRQAVSKWENGQSSPDTLNLIRLADVLDVDVEYLACGKEKASPSPSSVTVSKVVDRIVEVEKVVEVERIVEVEKAVKIETVIEKPVLKRVIRTKYLRNPIEYLLTGFAGIAVGVLIGIMI